MEKYICCSDEYKNVVQRGCAIIIDKNVARAEDGDQLDIDLDYLRKSPDFELSIGIDNDKTVLPEHKATYCVATKIARLFSSQEDAREYAESIGEGTVFIMLLCGAVSVKKTSTYTPYIGK